MINSMTGFARHEMVVGLQSWVFEIKSVNHRFLEIGLKLPEERRALEGRIRATLAKHMKRGKVDLWVSVRTDLTQEIPTSINPAALNPLLQLIKSLQLEAGSHGIDLAQPTTSEILRWPNVIQALNPTNTLSDDDLTEKINRLCDSFNEHRASEGLRLLEFLSERLEQLQTLVTAVRQALPEIQERMRNKLWERLEGLGSKVQVQPERFEQEVLLLLQKMDVEEELNRLEGHRLEIQKALAGNEPAGRRLDFLMQELNREANTLSSKSADANTTRLAVDLKVIIEQMREQVQNIE